MWKQNCSKNLVNLHRNNLIFFCICLNNQTSIMIDWIEIFEHNNPWPSLTTSPYRSSPLAGLQGYILYPHIAAECIFMLVVLLLPGHMWGSIRVHCKNLQNKTAFTFIRNIIKVWDQHLHTLNIILSQKW